MNHDKFSIVMILSSRRIAKDNQDNKDQNDTITTSTCTILHYTAIDDHAYETDDNNDIIIIIMILISS